MNFYYPNFETERKERSTLFSEEKNKINSSSRPNVEQCCKSGFKRKYKNRESAKKSCLLTFKFKHLRSFFVLLKQKTEA